MSEIAQCLNGPVKAGDLVRAALSCPYCGHNKHVGFEYRVVDLTRCRSRCFRCRTISTGWNAGLDDVSGYPVSRLIRIDPPAQPESIETEREVVA